LPRLLLLRLLLLLLYLPVPRLLPHALAAKHDVLVAEFVPESASGLKGSRAMFNT
jgi:hypothetical protein